MRIRGKNLSDLRENLLTKHSKVCFENGGWVSIRFSGTEPLLRVFSEMPERAQADAVCQIYRDALQLENG